MQYLKQKFSARAFARIARWSRIAVVLAAAGMVLAGPVRAGVISFLNYPAHERANNRGVQLREQGDAPGAALAFERAVALAPDVAEYHVNLLDIYAGYSSDIMKARGWTLTDIYGKILEQSRCLSQLRPGDYAAVSDYASTLMGAPFLNAQLDYDAAYQAWSDCLHVMDIDDKPSQYEEFKRSGVYCFLARVELGRGNPEAARGFAEQALALVPGSSAAANLLVKATAAE